MKKFVMFLMLISTSAVADDWVCKTQGAVSMGPGSVLVCGMAESSSEFDARIKAYSAAMVEFDLECKASDECKNRRIDAQPKRTECSKTDGGFRCYRAVEVTISDKPKDLDVEIAKRKNELADAQEAKIKEERLTTTENEIRLSRPDASFWSLGLGVEVNSAQYQKQSVLQVGYGGSLKRCLGGWFCPGVSMMLGKLVQDSEYVANVALLSADLTVFVSERWYLAASAGAATNLGTMGSGGIGYEAVKVQTVSLDLEGGVKGGENINAAPYLSASFNFRF